MTFRPAGLHQGTPCDSNGDPCDGLPVYRIGDTVTAVPLTRLPALPVEESAEPEPVFLVLGFRVVEIPLVVTGRHIERNPRTSTETVWGDVTFEGCVFPVWFDYADQSWWGRSA